MFTTDITFKNEKGQEIEYAPHSFAELYEVMKTEGIKSCMVGIQLCVYGSPDVQSRMSLEDVRQAAIERAALG